MKSFLYSIVIGCFLFLSACEFSTTINVQDGEALRVKRDDGFKVRFYPGQYQTQFSYSNNQVLMRIERNGIWTNVPVSIPAGRSLPENGSFTLLGSETGQTFDASGDIETVRSETELEQGYESCVYYTEEYVCRGFGRHRRCRWETVANHGLEEVEFYFETKTVTFDCRLNSTNGGVATFNGSKTTRRKIYTYRGECY